MALAAFELSTNFTKKMRNTGYLLVLVPSVALQERSLKTNVLRRVEELVKTIF